MSEVDPAAAELAPEHLALVRHVIRVARDAHDTDSLLILADRYVLLANHLAAGGFVRAARLASDHADRLRDVTWLSPTGCEPPAASQPSSNPQRST